MENEAINYKKATFFQRWLALIIDSSIIYFLILGVSYLFPSVFKTYYTFLPLIILLIYSILFLWIFGATPGKMLLKLKVLSNNYQTIGIGRIILRETFGKLLSDIFNLGYLWTLIDKNCQGWHDKIAKTYVVNVDSKGNLIPDNINSGRNIFQKIIIGFLVSIILIIPTLLIFTYIFITRPFQLYGNSMAPNYRAGQYQLANLMIYKFSPIQRGDIVVFKYENDFDRDFFARVIGLPGESISIKNGEVYINNLKLDESKYLTAGVKTYGGTFLMDKSQIEIPNNYYFVLGDNRPLSSDSRVKGLVAKKNIVGKLILCYWNCTSTNN